MLVFGVMFIVTHIFVHIDEMSKVIRDFGDWRAWTLVGLPAFVVGGLLITLAERLELKLKHKNRRLNPSNRV